MKRKTFFSSIQTFDIRTGHKTDLKIFVRGDFTTQCLPISFAILRNQLNWQNSARIELL